MGWNPGKSLMLHDLGHPSTSCFAPSQISHVRWVNNKVLYKNAKLHDYDRALLLNNLWKPCDSNFAFICHNLRTNASIISPNYELMFWWGIVGRR